LEFLQVAFAPLKLKERSVLLDLLTKLMDTP